ncbi:GAF domain-containing sensor histidine kinase [Halovivax limisalsi]|uniref:sensor histidine kinase n=1 Tax=Halovivax limisalsi TaxID=1453760 RepID=UPI001FFC9B80|nr:histidine kinase dimerization/phospho-acceptor domain-containing protein [Halovivax limisalsi]
MASTTDASEPLYEFVTQLEVAEQRREVYELAVDWVADVLGYQDCAVLVVEDGRFVPKAARATSLQPDVTPLGADEGVAGLTRRTGESRVVNGLSSDSTARPTDADYCSVLSVPVGSDGVFQLLSAEVDAFEEADCEIVERVATHVERALERISHASTITRERDRFAALFENVSDAVLEYRVADDAVRVERVNAAFVRHFGFEPAEAIDRRVDDLLVPDSDGAPVEYRAAVNAGERRDTEVVRHTSDGPQSFLLRAVPTDAADGGRGYLIYTDISTLKARERELERQNERLESFTSIVSHDLRNPLAIAQGYAEIAREDSATEHLSTVVEELDRMDRMIEELLTLAKKGEVVGETQPVDLAAAARSAWNHVETGTAELVVETDATIEADRPRLEELFENLYRNAIEHGLDDRPAADDAREAGDADGGPSPGEPALTVTVGSLEAALDGGFFVADDGRGIEPDERENVLEMGFSGAGGTGFGLGIVSEIARAHGWDVAVTESRDGGARFEFAGAGSGPA